MGDRFTLEWADYQKSLATTFVNARISQDFADVTLVGKDFELNAHRLVLSSGSDFFQHVLNRTKHHHPFVYLSGILKVNMESILSFLYDGEATVAQEDFEQFLLTAKELGVRGVLDQTDDDNDDVSTKPIQERESSFSGGNGVPEDGNDHVYQQSSPRRSSVWSHFERIIESLAICKMCGKEVQTKCSNTSGLWRHMASAHKETDINKDKCPPTDVKGDINQKGDSETISNEWMRDDLLEATTKDTNQREEDMKTNTKKLQAPRSRIWEQFHRLPEDLAVCKTCNRLELVFYIHACF